MEISQAVALTSGVISLGAAIVLICAVRDIRQIFAKILAHYEAEDLEKRRQAYRSRSV